jgi:hypothetical protein
MWDTLYISDEASKRNMIVTFFAAWEGKLRHGFDNITLTTPWSRRSPSPGAQQCLREPDVWLMPMGRTA